MKDDLCFNFPVGPICFHKGKTKQDSPENKSHVMEMLFNYSGAHGGVMVNTCNSGNITAECGKYEPTLNCFIKLLCRPGVTAGNCSYRSWNSWQQNCPKILSL